MLKLTTSSQIEKQKIMICTSADTYSGQYCKTPCWQFVPGSLRVSLKKIKDAK